MKHLKKFQSEFSVNEKQYLPGLDAQEANKTSFYEIANLTGDQKKRISELVDKTAAEKNIKTQINYKMLILGKLAGLDNKTVEELEKRVEENQEEFASLILANLSGMSMDQVKALQEL